MEDEKHIHCIHYVEQRLTTVLEEDIQNFYLNRPDQDIAETQLFHVIRYYYSIAVIQIVEIWRSEAYLQDFIFSFSNQYIEAIID